MNSEFCNSFQKIHQMNALKGIGVPSTTFFTKVVLGSADGNLRLAARFPTPSETE
jgi:hypothetical protein